MGMGGRGGCKESTLEAKGSSHAPLRGNMLYVINAYAYKNTQEQIQICERRIKQFCKSSTQRYCQHVYVFQKTYTPTDGVEINLDIYIQGKLFHPIASGFLWRRIPLNPRGSIRCRFLGGNSSPICQCLQQLFR